MKRCTVNDNTHDPSEPWGSQSHVWEFASGA